LRPAAAEELHVSPVCLRGFAPAVEGLVAFGLVGLAEGASRLAVALLESSGHVRQGEAAQPFGGKQSFRALQRATNGAIGRRPGGAVGQAAAAGDSAS